MHPNLLDPVREPEAANSSEPWVGNMLNDSREVFDGGSDVLRITDEEHSEFSNAVENEDVDELLRPGDLASLYS